MTIRPTLLPRALRLAACGLLAALSGLATPALAKDGVVAGEVLMKLQSTAQLPALLAKYNLTLLGSFGARPIYRTRVPAGGSAKDVAAALLLEPGVLVAEQNINHESPEGRKNQPWAVGTQAEYVAQWAPTALRLPEAHAIDFSHFPMWWQ